MPRVLTLIIALSGAVLAPPVPAHALTVEQFMAICKSTDQDCVEHPIVQAYVGGALDLLAVLDEETDYLGRVYCTSPRELFDVAAIIRYVQKNQADFAGRNAMLALVRYFEEEGGC